MASPCKTNLRLVRPLRYVEARSGMLDIRHYMTQTWRPLRYLEARSKMLDILHYMTSSQGEATCRSIVADSNRDAARLA